MNGPDDEHEAVEGICAEFYADVNPDDVPPPVVVGMFDPIPIPRDPLRQLSDDEE